MRRIDYIQTGYYCGYWSGDSLGQMVIELLHCDYLPGFKGYKTSFRASI